MSDKFEVEQVEAVTPPPKARVQGVVETFERKKDYLAGFLAQKPQSEPVAGAGGALQAAIVEVLKEIYDPEIPVNIYDLGLIYGVDVTDDGHAVITMTLTTPHCPVAESMPAEVELRVGAVPGERGRRTTGTRATQRVRVHRHQGHAPHGGHVEGQAQGLLGAR